MEKPLVSVIMPSYNHAEYVGKAIESVLNQTYTNFEFIIVDDASEDQSVEVIQQYKDSRIEFVRLKINTGFGAYEKCFNMAKGKYIAMLASDDMWKSDLLEKYVEFLEAHDEYLCCFSIPEAIDENDLIIKEPDMEKTFLVENRTKEQWFRKLYMEGNCFCAPSMCIRYSAFDQLGNMRYQYKQLQDYEYWMRLVQLGNIYVHPEKLIYYRKHYSGENVNVSAPSKEVDIRDTTERKYIMYDIMESVEDEFFFEAFKEDFVFQPESEGFCLDCEKYVVMLNSPKATVHAAIFYYFNHYKDDVFRYYMENFYQVQRKDIWKLTGVEHDRGMLPQVEQGRERELINMVIQLRKEVEEKEHELRKMNEGEK